MASRPYASSQRAGSASLSSPADSRRILPVPSPRLGSPAFAASPAWIQSTTIDEPSSTGRRKRPIMEEDDFENPTPRPIIMSPQSPSHIRNMAERGVCTFTSQTVACGRSPKHGWTAGGTKPLPPMPLSSGASGGPNRSVAPQWGELAIYERHVLKAACARAHQTKMTRTRIG